MGRVEMKAPPPFPPHHLGQLEQSGELLWVTKELRGTSHGGRRVRGLPGCLGLCT